MRSQLVGTTLLLLLLAACSRPERDQENVTVPGEGPTYRDDSAAAGALPSGDTLPAVVPRDTVTRPPALP